MNIAIPPSDPGVTPTASALDEGFKALADVVKSLTEAGRVPRSATVKLALQLRDPTFDEKSLGFQSFREFLRAAEAREIVRLSPAQRGPDVDVTVPGDSSNGQAGHKSTRIRSDLWDAFTRWGTGYFRLWDKSGNRAYRISDRGYKGEPVEDSDLREQYQKNPARFVPIPLISPTAIKDKMTEFAEKHRPGQTGDALLAALGSSKPYREFNQLVRRLGLGREWHEAYVSFVRDAMSKWADDAGLNLNLDAGSEPSLSTEHKKDGGRGAGLAPADYQNMEEVARTMAHKLIDRMTLTELLQLPLSLRHVVEADRQPS